jgi:hypothetical protein
MAVKLLHKGGKTQRQEDPYILVVEEDLIMFKPGKYENGDITLTVTRRKGKKVYAHVKYGHSFASVVEVPDSDVDREYLSVYLRGYGWVSFYAPNDR